MFEFKQYIIAVTAAAIVGCISISLCDKKSASSAVIKLLIGVMMTITILKPIIAIEIADISGYLSSVHIAASNSVQAGSAWADSKVTSIISEQTEAYILDKASSVGVQVDVDVTVCEQAPFMPLSVTVTGNVSPYLKVQLSEIIEEDVGVSKENQTWKK